MNKRLFAVVFGLVLIAVFVVLNVFVFTVSTVSVDFDIEEAAAVEEGLDEKIISASGIKTGKNIFAVSESKIVENIQSSLTNVRVLNVERIFPNKIILHVSRRIPVYLIAYRATASDRARYVLLDSDMVVLDFLDAYTSSYTVVEGFSLLGRYRIATGEVLPLEFGDQIYYLQNIAAGFYNADANITPSAYVTFVKGIVFNDNGSIDIKTNSGVALNIAGGLTTEDICERVEKAYAWYMSQDEGSAALTGGIALYNSIDGKYVHYSGI